MLLVEFFHWLCFKIILEFLAINIWAIFAADQAEVTPTLSPRGIYLLFSWLLRSLSAPPSAEYQQRLKPNNNLYPLVGIP
jgi:hypothetical protein